MPLVTKQIVAFVFCLSLVVSVTTKIEVLAQDMPTEESSTESAGAAGGNTGLNLDMKLDDLVRQDVVIPGFSQVVNTVDRQESTVGRSPAAVFVITPEMIKRSGARSIPEALRMAPGVEVAQIGSDIWAISIRGFNGRFANKLLVQIDGRAVYTLDFGGVYWNQQDVVLEDIERIEVIRGPGAVMWGSNAVNGVINILTKKSSDTQGAFIESGGGNQERDFNTVRYGGRVNEDLTWRIYAKEFNRNSTWSDIDMNNTWLQHRGGFRIDYTPNEEDTLTLQGDLFAGHGTDYGNESIPTPPFVVFSPDKSPPMNGGNILFRYGRVLDEDTSWQLQAYYDHYQAVTTGLPTKRDTYDLDLQYQFSPWENHQFITGANYLNSPNVTNGGFYASMDPPNAVTQWVSAFAQDTMTLEEDRWYFTLGTRLEYNTFGKFQPDATARLLFLPSDRQSMWASISRAVRMPMRQDRQLDVHAHIGPPGVPLFLNALGNPDFEPENLIAYEIGYREAPTDDFSWDIAGYINDYHKLRGFDGPGPPVVVPPGFVFIPLQFANSVRALSYGFELTANLQLTDDWRLYGSCSVFEINAQGDPQGAAQVNGSSPHNQVYLRSSWDIGQDKQFDLIGRYVDRLSALDVPQYIEMDARIAWQATKTLEFSFVGQNLLDSHHLEFVDVLSEIPPSEVRRGWYGMITWTY
jgi:iron complex outermembrane recepter protein